MYREDTAEDYDRADHKAYKQAKADRKLALATLRDLARYGTSPVRVEAAQILLNHTEGV